MSTGLYERLREHLDSMPVGFPKTDTGVELKILERLFSEDEAHVALCLDYRFQSPKEINQQLRGNLESLKAALESMASKGSIYSKKVQDEYHYALSPYVVGMYEMQIGRLELDFLKNTKQFFNKGFGKEYLATKVPQMRVIPVERSVRAENQVATYDEIRAIIEKAEGRIGVMDCLCRKGRDMGGYPCKTTSLRETCFSFGDYHHMLSRFGWCRDISKEEALEIIAKAEEDGLVLQPSNEQEPRLVCACCGCCCGILTTLKALPRPVDRIASNFQAAIDRDQCFACGVCGERCPMDAINTGDDETAEVNLDRCIGCGVCVSSCEQGAVALIKKDKETTPPQDMDELYRIIMESRKRGSQ